MQQVPSENADESRFYAMYCLCSSSLESTDSYRRDGYKRYSDHEHEAFELHRWQNFRGRVLTPG